MRLGFALALLSLSAAAGVPAPSQASPQILALLSTEGPVPLECEGAICTAELSAFCLEEKRATPELGTFYRAPAGAGIVLIVTAGDGSVREIDGAPHALFASLRDMTAVRVTVDRRLFGDGARVAIRAGTASALLPEASRRHGRAHTPAEIAHATGPLRAAAARIVDGSPAAEVARGLSRALNLLRHEDHAAAALLAGAAAPVVRACAAKVASEAAGRRQIVGVYGYWTGRAIVGAPSLKICLEEAHGTLMTALNRRFWRGDAGGTETLKAAPHM